MKRINKRRVDSVFKKKPIFETFSSGSKICIGWYKKMKTSELNSNRFMTFETDPNDIWEHGI